MPARTEEGVCLSFVKRVHCDKTEERSVQFFYTIRKIGGERPLLPEILGQTGRVEAKSPIFDLFSLEAPQS